MALLFIESFDHYATADLTEKWSASAGSTIVAAAGRHASAALRTSNSSHYVKRTGLSASGSVVAIGVALKPSDLSGLTPAILEVHSGGTVQLSLGNNSSGQFRVSRGTQWGGTQLGISSGTTLTVGAYAYVELLATLHASAGAVEVRINGVAVLTLSGVNTAASGTAWDAVALGDPAASRSCPGDWDDLYVMDGSGAAPWNTFLGDCRVDVCRPTGAGATTGWTPSTGANWQCVDDAAPNDDTDYAEATAAGAVDTFVTEDAPAGGSIIGIQHTLSLRKTDAGTCTVAAVVRHSGADYVSADLAPGTTYAYGLVVQQTNPGTGVAWTAAGFNACEFGYKRTG